MDSVFVIEHSVCTIVDDSDYIPITESKIVESEVVEGSERKIIELVNKLNIMNNSTIALSLKETKYLKDCISKLKLQPEKHREVDVLESILEKERERDEHDYWRYRKLEIKSLEEFSIKFNVKGDRC